MAKQIHDDQASNSSKISIRRYRLADVDDFMTYYGDDKVTRFTRMHTFKSHDEASTYINTTCIPHPFCRSICYDDRSIGYISITPGSGDDRCMAQVGYALAATYWGQGIVSKALKMAICDFLEEFPFVVRLQALVEVENKGSQRLLEKVGFSREGLLRKYTINKGEIKDILIFSVVSTDSMFEFFK